MAYIPLDFELQPAPGNYKRNQMIDKNQLPASDHTAQQDNVPANEQNKLQRRWLDNCFDHESYGEYLLTHVDDLQVRTNRLAGTVARMHMSMQRAINELLELARKAPAKKAERIKTVIKDLQENYDVLYVRDSDFHNK